MKDDKTPRLDYDKFIKYGNDACNNLLAGIIEQAKKDWLDIDAEIKELTEITTIAECRKHFAQWRKFTSYCKTERIERTDDAFKEFKAVHLRVLKSQRTRLGKWFTDDSWGQTVCDGYGDLILGRLEQSVNGEVPRRYFGNAPRGFHVVKEGGNNNV